MWRACLLVPPAPSTGQEVFLDEDVECRSAPGAFVLEGTEAFGERHGR